MDVVVKIAYLCSSLLLPVKVSKQGQCHVYLLTRLLLGRRVTQGELLCLTPSQGTPVSQAQAGQAGRDYSLHSLWRPRCIGNVTAYIVNSDSYHTEKASRKCVK